MNKRSFFAILSALLVSAGILGSFFFLQFVQSKWKFTCCKGFYSPF